MKKYSIKKRVIFISIISIMIIYMFQIYSIVSIPPQLNIVKGQSEKFKTVFPFTLNVFENNKIIESNNKKNFNKMNATKTYDFKFLQNGIATIEYKLFNFIPIKDVKLNVIDRIKLIPGGHSIGVKLNTKGVLVVALSEITGLDGKKYCPAREAGIKVGDIILEIDKVSVNDSNHVVEILNNIKSNTNLILERNGHKFETQIEPIKCNEDNCYRIGLWVRDKTAGIGTLTFYHQESNKFGALGHGIQDIDTGKLMPVKKGEILHSKVSSIDQGKKGTPGEIKGVFYDCEKPLGNIKKNTLFGIYGDGIEKIENPVIPEAIPAATMNEVKLGKAFILTTTKDNQIKSYEIEIIKKEFQAKKKPKSMVIKVIDSELLSESGGIVQGMSGSPIIQNGKLIGAVTHVFVNDPTKGYGIYIDWMLDECGIKEKEVGKFFRYK
ncbi:SpoIVB peptidase [Abyssisolibacter fermentans]|uniref:SpoIVB peptidase n=1 Tax=Abyssisolibacter fermentans TaxID=1766203 RepID=UPI000A721DF0|nr:SpoIVB peptidase [Abyssisolibacter fermentans]